MKNGRLRGLAVTTAQRSKVMPDLPTIAEAGVPGYESSTWYGLFAPAGTPAPILARLNREVVGIVESDGFKQRLAGLGIEPRTSSQQEFAAVIKADIARWREIVIATGAKVD